MFLEISQNSQENTCASLKACNFIEKETLAQVFSCELCEISKNTFFTEHLCATTVPDPRKHQKQTLSFLMIFWDINRVSLNGSKDMNES